MTPHDGIVYGPVRSRRLGRSLGINLLPSGMKVCNMNCVYCQYGWTRSVEKGRGRAKGWPSPDVVAIAAEQRLKRAADADELLDRVTIAGHGEPTLHPEFEEVTARLCDVRDRIAPGLPLAIMSNSTTVGWPDVRRGLARYDERYMKLDAGDPMTYALVSGARPSFTDVVEGLRTLPSIVIQSMFVTEHGHQVDNSTEGAIREWLEILESIHPLATHIDTIDRVPAAEGLKPVSRTRLREIAAQVRAAGIAATVFA